MNENIKTNISSYWRELIIIILFVIMIIFYYQWDKTKKEWTADIALRRAGEVSNEINKPSNDITIRETEIYPKIDMSITELNKTIKALKEYIAKEEKNKPTKEQSYAIFKNQSTTQINSYFNNIGIPTTIKSCISK